MGLPKKYAWLSKEPAPRLLLEMIKLYGTFEDLSSKSNPLILKWAKEIGLGNVYKSDAIAWCGLAQGYAAAQAGWDYAPRGNALWARNWLFWGDEAKVAMLGDVLVFKRGNGGHVGIYIAEDKTAYHVLGGNQDDAVNIKRVAKSRLLGARRCPWRVNQPPNIRRIWMDASGAVSKNEA